MKSTQQVVKDIEHNIENAVDTVIETAFETHKPKKTGVFRYIKKLLEHNRLGELLVIRGYITPLELKHALNTQIRTNKPIGEILISSQKITKRQLNSILMRQRAIRFAAALVLCFSSFGAVKKSHASGIKDVPARIMLASAKGMKLAPNKANTLFGAYETRSTNLKAFTKWSDMFDRFDKELSQPSSQRMIHELKAELNGFKSTSVYQMAQDVNDLMNEKRYITDNNNWGKSDYWATPLEFMARGGDCEDYAIAKYVALRALGVAEESMRIAIVQDLQKNIPHAILIVYSERGTVILDNQIKDVRRDNAISHYKPIFSINRTAWWLHTAPKSQTATIVASAN